MNLPLMDSLLFWSSPDVEAEPFLFKAINDELALGANVVLCVTDKSSSVVLDFASSFGYSFDGLRIIDLHNDVISKLSGDALLSKIKAFAGKGVTLCVNNSSVLVDNYGPGFLRKLSALSSKHFFVLTDWGYDSSISDELINSFKSRVYLNFVNGKRYCSLQEGGNFRHFAFDLLRPGGITELPSRVLVLGPSGSGKSSLIQRLSDNKAVIDSLSSNFDVDYGFNNNFEFFSSKGGNFHQMIDLVGESADIALVVVDPLRSDLFPEAVKMINDSLSNGLMVIVGVNDFRNLGFDEGELRASLGVNVPLINVNSPDFLSKLLNQ